MKSLTAFTRALFGKEVSACVDPELYAALVALIKEATAGRPRLQGEKKLYYISAEFLLGRLLGNNLINLGLYQQIDAELAAAGKSLSQIEAQEAEPSLGNGGLGRLAACYMDSVATLGLPGDGVGLCYHFGLFRQRFQENKQMEEKNPWIEAPSWLSRSDITFSVPFGRFTAQAALYDIDVAGYESGVNRLRLFDIATLDESIVKDGISFDQSDILRNLTLFLYPDDSTEAGRLLRVYQQYFMVSCAAQLILREIEAAGHPLSGLHRHAVIQINDTHPSMVIPELIRLLLEKGISFDDAADIVSKTCAYTNHTILAEALEKWPLSYIEEVAPQIVPILKKLDARAKALYPAPEVAIIDDRSQVHMAHLDIHYGFSVNGVAALHTGILETSELAPFYDIYPAKFNNKTNGVTFRRWLTHCNPALDTLIEEKIGAGFRKDAGELEKLLAYMEDQITLQAMADIKRRNKRSLCEYLKETQGISLAEDAVFDIQIKRLHEYKRQQMNALYAIHKYLEIKAGRLPERPIAMIFGGKAAPAYVLAKDIIHLILCLQELTANDPKVSPWLRVVMVENYNVTLAEKLIPACDISEQISLASKEASGTGNMKFMLNGAVTLGTLDGANVEIHDLVGDENMYLFGTRSEDVIALYRTGGYSPAKIYRNDPAVERLVDFIVGPEMRRLGDMESLLRLYKDLTTKDWFMALMDLRAYIEAKERALRDFEDQTAWRKKMLVNTAMAGFFSSDRSIREYDRDIWHLT